MTPECKEHFYVRESLKDLRKEQYRIKRDFVQMKIILFIILVNTFGITNVLAGWLF